MLKTYPHQIFLTSLNRQKMLCFRKLWKLLTYSLQFAFLISATFFPIKNLPPSNKTKKSLFFRNFLFYKTQFFSFKNVASCRIKRPFWAFCKLGATRASQLKWRPSFVPAAYSHENVVKSRKNGKFFEYFRGILLWEILFWEKRNCLSQKFIFIYFYFQIFSLFLLQIYSTAMYTPFYQ
jgi:hypothetical protein